MSDSEDEECVEDEPESHLEEESENPLDDLLVNLYT